MSGPTSHWYRYLGKGDDPNQTLEVEIDETICPFLAQSGTLLWANIARCFFTKIHFPVSLSFFSPMFSAGKDTRWHVRDCMTQHAATPLVCGAKLLSGSVAGPLTGSVTQIPHSRRQHAGSRTHLLKRCPFRPTQCTIGRLVPASSPTASG